MKTMIEYRNISKKYNDKTILEPLNLTIDEGEFVTILGSSGSGKTTLLKMVNHLTAPTTGEVLVESIPVTEK